jgi:hypothetical protein
MEAPHRRATLIALLAAASSAVAHQTSTGERSGGAQISPFPPRQEDPKLPNGKSQRDEILKAERDQNLKDAAELADLAQQLQQDIEKNGAFVFSLSTMKKTDDIEKLAKKIRGRMRHN